jgi:DNA-binding PadR family transcriptional regulator
MGIYQPSSGALYPALRRLEAKGLVRAMALDGAGESARRRRVYEPTEVGQAAHIAWLRTPVESSTVSRDLGLHLVRFVMMEHAFSRDEVLGFLDNLSDALAAFTAELERYAAVPQVGDRHPRLALDHGLAVHHASLEWAGFLPSDVAVSQKSSPGNHEGKGCAREPGARCPSGLR